MNRAHLARVVEHQEADTVRRSEVAKRLAQVRELVAAAEANLEEKERVHGLCKPRERMMAIVQAQSRLLFAYEAYYRLREMYG